MLFSHHRLGAAWPSDMSPTLTQRPRHISSAGLFIPIVHPITHTHTHSLTHRHTHTHPKPHNTRTKTPKARLSKLEITPWSGHLPYSSKRTITCWLGISNRTLQAVTVKNLNVFLFECPAYQQTRTKYGSKLFSRFGVNSGLQLGSLRGNQGRCLSLLRASRIW